MHESGLIQTLLDRVLEIAAEADGNRVTSVSVRIGAFSSFSPDHLAEHFRLAAEGTAAEGAELNVLVDSTPTGAVAQDVKIMAVEIENA